MTYSLFECLNCDENLMSLCEEAVKRHVYNVNNK